MNTDEENQWKILTAILDEAIANLTGLTVWLGECRYNNQKGKDRLCCTHNEQGEICIVQRSVNFIERIQ